MTESSINEVGCLHVSVCVQTVARAHRVLKNLLRLFECVREMPILLADAPSHCVPCCVVIKDFFSCSDRIFVHRTCLCILALKFYINIFFYTDVWLATW